MRLQKSWLVQIAFLDNAIFPTPTRDTIKITGAVQSLVAELEMASSVIYLLIAISSILSSAMSDDDIHGIVPCQYASLVEDGVPPPMKSAIFFIG